MVLRKTKVRKYFTLLLCSLSFFLPTLASSMCEEPVPIKVKIKVTNCTEKGIKGFIQELQGREITDEQELRWSSTTAGDCTKFKLGQTVETTVIQACCDTPNIPCYFGDIVPENVK